MTLEDRILRLARLGMTPYQIEEQLGIKHFTIHISCHKTLMQGYSENEAFFERTSGEQLSGTVTEKFLPDSLKKRPCQRDADRGRTDRKTKDKTGGGQSQKHGEEALVLPEAP